MHSSCSSEIMCFKCCRVCVDDGWFKQPHLTRVWLDSGSCWGCTPVAHVEPAIATHTFRFGIDWNSYWHFLKVIVSLLYFSAVLRYCWKRGYGICVKGSDGVLCVSVDGTKCGWIPQDGMFQPHGRHQELLQGRFDIQPPTHCLVI